MDKMLFSKSFQQRLISLNHLELKEWVFHPAMLFGSQYKWWGDKGKRDGPHEGLDLCLYRTGQGNINRLNEKTEIPLIFPGRVANVIKDFLGQSIFVSHEIYDEKGWQLYTVYGHIKPIGNGMAGKTLDEGSIIGTIAAAQKGGSKIPPHLHISAAWISGPVHPRELSWQMMGSNSGVVLIDPLAIIALPDSISQDI